MIYEGLGFPIPQFGHISLVLDDDRQKLSKRKGAVACDNFRRDGYLPEAMNNFMALMGWSHPKGDEIFSMMDMKNLFSLERLNASGAVFDRVKLKWMNSQYLRAMDSKSLWQSILPFLNEAKIQLPNDLNWQMQSVEVFKPKMEIFSDAVGLYEVFDDSKFMIHPESDEFIKIETTKLVLQTWKDLVFGIQTEYMTTEDFIRIENEIKIKAGVKGKNLFMPMRVAVIGKPHGTELKLIVPLIKKLSLLDRVQKVIDVC
jgi:nondiscriminating glutamyl-tRNA synthetase